MPTAIISGHHAGQANSSDTGRQTVRPGHLLVRSAPGRRPFRDVLVALRAQSDSEVVGGSRTAQETRGGPDVQASERRAGHTDTELPVRRSRRAGVMLDGTSEPGRLRSTQVSTPKILTRTMEERLLHRAKMGSSIRVRNWYSTGYDVDCTKVSSYDSNRQSRSCGIPIQGCLASLSLSKRFSLCPGSRSKSRRREAQ